MSEGTGEARVASAEVIATSLQGLERRAAKLASGKQRAAAYWRLVATWMGMPAAVLAAAAGVLVLTDGDRDVLAAVLAFLAAALASVVGFVRPDARSRKAAMMAVICQDYERRTRSIREADLPAAEPPVARGYLDRALGEWNEIMWAEVENDLVRHRPSGVGPTAERPVISSTGAPPGSVTKPPATE